MDSGNDMTVGEGEVDYIKRLRTSVENQCTQTQDLVAINAIMTEALAKTGGASVESLKLGLERKHQQLESVTLEKAKVESKESMYRDICEKQESTLNSVLMLVDRLGDKEEEAPLSDPHTEANKAKEEAEKEREAEVSKLLVSLGQEQSRVEKLSGRLAELGWDADELLEGVGDDARLLEETERNGENAELIDGGIMIEDNVEVVEENEDDAELVDEEGEMNKDDAVLVEDLQENEDDTELVDEGVTNEDDAELVDEGETNEDDAGLVEETEENENDSEVVNEEGETNEDNAGLPEESKEVDNSGSTEESSVKRLLDRISNGPREDRENAMDELANIIGDSADAKLEFGATGFPVVTSVLKKERGDVDMVRSALSILNNALLPSKEEFEDALMCADLFSRESSNISLLLSFLILQDADDFFTKVLILKILTNLVKEFPNRLREAIVEISPAITRFIDMLADKMTLILQFLIQFTNESEEIQKIMVSKGAFERIFGVIEDEGGSDGGYAVELCLHLLNTLLLRNKSNQKLLQETMGFDPLLSVLKLQGIADSFSERKVKNVLCGLNTVRMLSTDSEEDSLAIKTTLVQKNILDHLLMLSVESQEAPVDVRCSALKFIGDLISGNPENRDALASKVIGEETQEPVLNSLLRFLLRTSSAQEFVAADCIFKIFCEKNPEGQAMLASTLAEEEPNESFGRILLQGFTLTDSEGDLETCCRAASVLSHVLKDNDQCKERVLGIKLKASTTSGASEPLLMGVIIKLLAIASFVANKSKPTLLKLLVIWLADCPDAVKLFLDSHPNLTLLLELLSNESESTQTKGLASLVLGECVIYNEASKGVKDALAVLRTISQKVEITSYFPNFDDTKDEDPVLSSIFDTLFETLVKKVEADIREKIEELRSLPESNEAAVPPELERRSEESESDYVNRLKEFSEKQCTEIQGLLASNAAMAEDLAKTGGVVVETLVRDLRRASENLRLVKSEKAKAQAEALMHLEISDEFDAELRRVNRSFHDIKFELARSELPDTEAIKAKARANSLSVWLGHERTKVEKLRAKLVELGEDVDKLPQ